MKKCSGVGGVSFSDVGLLVCIIFRVLGFSLHFEIVIPESRKISLCLFTSSYHLRAFNSLVLHVKPLLWKRILYPGDQNESSKYVFRQFLKICCLTQETRKVPVS